MAAPTLTLGALGRGLLRGWAAGARAGRRGGAAAGGAAEGRRGKATEALAPAAADAPAFGKWASPAPAPQGHVTALRRLPATTVTELPSGLRVATAAVPHAETATVGVWIDAGSRFETAASNGAAHFLEHMAFKGTAKRSARALEEQVEDMGAHLNAYTSREQTTYYAKVLGKDVGRAVDMLADILQGPLLEEAAIERERGVILREMQEVEGLPDEVLFDHLHATAFQHCPLGRTILGPADNIRSLTKKDLADYIATHYTAPRMVVVGAGAVDHQQLVDLAGKAFEQLPTTPKTTADFVAEEPAIFTGSEVRIRDPDMEKVHLAMCVKGASWADPDSVPLMVMQHMLGSWDKDSPAGVNPGSVLAQRVSANSLADSFMAFNTHYTDTGLFGLYAVSDGEKLDDLAWAMMHDFTALAYAVDDIAVARAQNQLKASILASTDGTSGLAEEIGRQLLTYGRHIPKEEMFARIDAVDVDTVKGVADRFIKDNEISIAAMGDTTSLPDYHWFRRMTYWLTY